MPERICRYCTEVVPEGTIGPYCSNECKWQDARKQAGDHGSPMCFQPPKLNGMYHGKYPQRR